MATCLPVSFLQLVTDSIAISDGVKYAVTKSTSDCLDQVIVRYQMTPELLGLIFVHEIKMTCYVTLGYELRKIRETAKKRANSLCFAHRLQGAFPCTDRKEESSLA